MNEKQQITYLLKDQTVYISKSVLYRRVNYDIDYYNSFCGHTLSHIRIWLFSTKYKDNNIIYVFDPNMVCSLFLENAVAFGKDDIKYEIPSIVGDFKSTMSLKTRNDEMMPLKHIYATIANISCYSYIELYNCIFEFFIGLCAENNIKIIETDRLP